MRLNRDKRIGRVLFVVEGSRTEFSILRKIFCELLQYEYIEKRRNRLDSFYSPRDEYSRVAVVNTRESNIKDITEESDYMDRIYDMLRSQYHFPVEKSAVYYLFDRDPLSNTNVQQIREYVRTLSDPYDNAGTVAGQLLLSYPSIESYIISGFCENAHQLRMSLGRDAKQYIAQNREIQLNKITETTLLGATAEFIHFLESEQLLWNIDDFAPSSSEIFERQEQWYQIGEGYKIFSLLTLAFLQMGIIDL